MKVQGNYFKSTSVKERGNVMEYQSEQGPSGTAEFNCLGNHTEVGFTSGRTIELRRFEFARIKIGLRAKIPNGSGIDRDAVSAAMERWVGDRLGTEEAEVKHSPVPAVTSTDADRQILSEVKCRCVDIGYGLTLKSAKEYESHTVDIHYDEPVSDKADLDEFFNTLSDRMAEWLDVQHNRIRDIGKTSL